MLHPLKVYGFLPLLALLSISTLIQAETTSKGDSKTKVTNDLQSLINATPLGGELHLQAGQYTVASVLTISKPITVSGTGLGTQIYQPSDDDLFHISQTNGVVFRDLYLGSAATSPGKSLIKIENSHHGRFENVTMLGGNYGIYLLGSLLNTFIDLRSGTNFGGFYASTSSNSYWVFGDASNGYSDVANTFIAPV